MDVYRYPGQVKPNQTVLVLGAFESLHRGHALLFEKARKLKKPLGVLLFSDPSQIPSKSHDRSYNQLAVRLQQLAALGFKFAYLVDFAQVKDLDGVSFVKQIVHLTNAQTLVVGEKFRFGQNRQASVEDLKKWFPSTLVIKHLKSQSVKLSTRELKQLITLGEVALVNERALFPFTFQVQVDQKGRFDYPPIVKPLPGIYAVWVFINAIRYWGFCRITDQDCQLVVPDYQFELGRQTCRAEILASLRFFNNENDQVVKKSDFVQAREKIEEYLRK